MNTAIQIEKLYMVANDALDMIIVEMDQDWDPGRMLELMNVAEKCAQTIKLMSEIRVSREV